MLSWFVHLASFHHFLSQHVVLLPSSSYLFSSEDSVSPSFVKFYVNIPTPFYAYYLLSCVLSFRLCY